MAMSRHKEKEIDSIFKLLEEDSKRKLFEIDDQILKKYDKNNKHFSINATVTEGATECLIIGFYCIYQYENNRIELVFKILNRIWGLYNEFNLKGSDKLSILLKEISSTINLSFEQQIQLIINEFDQYFYELNQKEENSNGLRLEIPLSKPSTIIEVNEEQTGLPVQREIIDSNRLTSPVTRHARHDSSCNSTNSIKYTQFVPSSTTSVLRRRVIQSIHLRVGRKKKLLEKFVDQLKDKSIEPTMYQLGLEFLRLYDGKFNYPQGYTFVISFKKRTWYLTISNIKCVECQLGQPEPRSILILQYKNKFTTVQV